MLWVHHFTLSELDPVPLPCRPPPQKLSELLYQDVAELKLTDTLPAAFEALARGEVDFVLADALLSYSFINSEIRQRLEIIGNTISDQELSSLSFIQVRKGNLKLRDAINQALRDIKSDGTYREINAKYFPIDVY